MTTTDAQKKHETAFLAEKNASRRSEWHHQNHLAAEREIRHLKKRIAGLEAQIASLKAGRFIDGNDKPF
jgi:polyhydroxyalkanoate synthesis regulator phasin